MKHVTIEGEILEIGSGIQNAKAHDVKGNRVVERDFVKIGKQRLRAVTLTSYMDNFLKVGKRVTISGVQHKNNFVLAAIRLDDGEIIINDTSSAALFVQAAALIIPMFFLAIIPAFLITALIGGVASVRSDAAQITIFAISMIAIWTFASYRFVILPWKLLRQARAALGSATVN